MLQEKNIYGLIGKKISYSFSKNYFTNKFKKSNLDSNYTYENLDLDDINQFKNILKQKKFNGFNVTIPYKEKIIPFIDELSPVAKEIGSVNTICFHNSKKIGHNTDIFGFDKTLSEINIDNIKHALVLGTGGASKAIRYVLSKRKINYSLVSRKKKEDSLLYNALDTNLFNQNLLIINSTPLGTYPTIEEFPDIPYKYLDSKHILYDLVYNPIETAFMKKGKEKGARVINGLKMLEYQAEKSWELWHEFN